MPEKFNLTYESEAGSKKRPVMLHRAIYGSLERFMGILIEHFAGWFPLWISPVQARVITVSNKFNEYGEEVYNVLRKSGIRVEFNGKAETTGKKVRDAQMSKIPLLITIGDKEIKQNTIAVRTNKDGKVEFGVNIKDLIEKIKLNVEKKSIEFKI